MDDVLVCLTANHRNAGFDLLDRLSVGAPQATSELVAGGPAVDGAVVIATCNRFEAYLDVDAEATDAPASVDHAIAVMSAAGGVSADELRDAVTVLVGDRVPAHLFSVSAGLESVVIGEEEIAGQVSRAYETARADGTTSAPLDRMFQRAASTSRAVRGATDLGGSQRSLVRLALELASSRVTDWAHARVLVVGTGTYAATTIAALRDRGVRDIGVYSATGRADRFAEKYGYRAEHDLRAGIERAELVITCTAKYTVAAADIRPGPRRLVIDLGLPRNVDPDVARVDGVELLDLELIARHAPLPEFATDAAARALVGDAAAAFAAEREAAPAIVALRAHVFDLLDEEIARARRRGAGEETVESLRHLAGVLLHGPSVRARELAADGRADEFAAALEAMFGVRPAAPVAELESRTPASGRAGDASASA